MVFGSVAAQLQVRHVVELGQRLQRRFAFRFAADANNLHAIKKFSLSGFNGDFGIVACIADGAGTTVGVNTLGESVYENKPPAGVGGGITQRHYR